LELVLLDEDKAEAIMQAAQEVASGDWDDQFPIDIFQTGSGTSTNMNANEVIANRASQILGGELGSKLVHPNDDVNLCQSSNDVIPAAIHVSAFILAQQGLLPALRHLHLTLERRSAELEGVVKTGRTHLMDAMPVRLSQEISGWAYQVVQSTERIEGCMLRLGRLAIGGTAVGTGINAHPEFGGRVAAVLAERTGLPFVETEHHFAAQASMDTATELSGHLKTTASALMKIANDLRWMNSGPIAGLGEITLPALQPGSSIMPGKINPVICVPLIADNLLESIAILGNAAQVLADKAVAGFTVNRERIAELVERNPILVTALNPVIGYDKAAQIAKRAYAEGRRMKEVAAEMTDLSPEELDRLLDPQHLTQGGIGEK
jgi:fumarate hydratase class II